MDGTVADLACCSSRRSSGSLDGVVAVATAAPAESPDDSRPWATEAAAVDRRRDAPERAAALATWGEDAGCSDRVFLGPAQAPRTGED